MKTFGKILLTLLILGGLGYGGWYGYNRFFAEAPKEGTVYVQSVATITGVGAAGRRSRYAGVVEAKNVIQVNPDTDLTVKECFVSAGDKVKKGDPLFSYDVASMEINLEQLQLDIQGLENGIKTGQKKVENLKKQLARVKESKKYDIQMEIQTEELEIRKREYDLTGKHKQADDIANALENSVVLSTVTGTVRSVRSLNGNGDLDFDTQDTAYITIVAGNDYCVKGTVSEQTIHTLQEGMDVRIMSRVDSTVWPGYIYKINTEKAKQNSGRYYYGGSDGEQASKYEFFVALETNEGLLMGQHVYIELGAESSDEPEGLWLPTYYVVEDEGDPFVYAADGKGRIEKRKVVLGQRNEDMDTVCILEGLSYMDRIAFPDDTVQVGMVVSETAYTPEGMDVDDPADMGNMPDTLSGFEGAIYSGSAPADPGKSGIGLGDLLTSNPSEGDVDDDSDLPDIEGAVG